jgi:NAD(P)-dependent dehydrogenase (short-subunit alcohol dehydrogenase family)
MKPVVVITGVQRGIGKATAEQFSKNGWHVIGIGKREETKLPDIDHFIKADVSEESGWEKIHREIQDNEGHIDALVNNAAIQICKPVIETTVEEWDETMATNLRSVFLSVHSMVPLFGKNGGAIINISSVHALATSKNISAYAASKGAIDAFTRALSLELAPLSIRVNAVLPGAVDTDMLREGLSRDHIKGNTIDDGLLALGKKHALGRIGKPEEIARIIFFLVGKDASFITGQRIVADGGALARLSTE